VLVLALLLAMVAAQTASALGAPSEAPTTPAAPAIEQQLDPDTRIVGGTPTTVGEFPFLAALVRSGEGDTFQGQYCAGSVIASTWILTAAHCVTNTGATTPVAATSFQIVTGRHNLDCSDFGGGVPACTVGQRINVKSVIVHPGWNPATNQNDIALVELLTPTTTPAVPWAQLSQTALFQPGTAATLIGWGNTNPAAPSYPVIPLKVNLDIISDDACVQPPSLYTSADIFAAVMLCAGDLANGMVDSCQGDSGGPLLVPSGSGWLQVGIVSWGVGCGLPGFPGVNTEVAAFESWIGENIAAPERWAGADRYATSVVVSQKAFPSGANTVFLATGQSFPDALAAGPAAAKFDAPILLTRTDQLPAAVTAELQRLDPSVVYLLGGSAAVSPSVAAQVDAATDAQIERLAGSDRYATAAAVAEEAFPDADEVYVATGEGFADALSAGSPGGILGRPVLLTRSGSLPGASQDQITRLANPDVILLGGPSAVGSAVVTELDSLTTGTVERVSGANRYATSVAVSVEAFDAADTVFLATGSAFPDALSAAPAAATLGAPILLTTPTCAPPQVISEVNRLGADRVVTLGGPNAVSDAAANLTACR
jgi:secreted trypsin-like serine protease